MKEFIELITTNGLGVVICAYILYRDYKFNDKLVRTLDKLEFKMNQLEKAVKNNNGNK